jgi:hypothetical protein
LNPDHAEELVPVSVEHPYVESITQCETSFFTVRVWRRESRNKPLFDNDDIGQVIERFTHCDNRVEVSRAIELLPRVTAVEVKHGVSGCGSVVYTEWP